MPVKVLPLSVIVPNRRSCEDPGMPASKLRRVVLPAPEGPMIAKRWPDTTRPETSCRMVLAGAVSRVTEQSRKSNMTSFAMSGCAAILMRVTAEEGCRTLVLYDRASALRQVRKERWGCRE